MDVKQHNKFNIKVESNGNIKEYTAYNIVLDNRFNQYLGNFNWFYAIHVGTGTGTLDKTRTSLFNFLAGGARGVASFNYENYRNGEVSYSASYTWLAGQLPEGSILTEVGISASTIDNGSLCTHALILDEVGNPTSITVGTNDNITIEATIFLYFNTEGYGNNYIGNGLDYSLLPDTAYNFLWLISGLAGVGTAIQLTRGNLLHGNRFANSVVNTTISNNTVTTDIINRKLLFKTSYNETQMNGTGDFENAGIMGYIQNNGGATWSSIINYPLIYTFPNTDNNGFFIESENVGSGDGATVDFATKFGFIIDDSNAKVYINGIELTEGYSIDYDTPNINRIGIYFNIVEEQSNTTLKWETNSTSSSAGYTVVENPYYERFGLHEITGGSSGDNFQVSNDLVNWVNIIRNGTVVDESQTNMRYYKVGNPTMNTGSVTRTWSNDITGKCLHFDTPPAQGDIITIDYTTALIPKNNTTTIDLEFSVTIGTD